MTTLEIIEARLEIVEQALETITCVLVNFGGPLIAPEVLRIRARVVADYAALDARKRAPPVSTEP